VLYAAVRSFDRQVVMNVRSVQFSETAMTDSRDHKTPGNWSVVVGVSWPWESGCQVPSSLCVVKIS